MFLILVRPDFKSRNHCFTSGFNIRDYFFTFDFYLVITTLLFNFKLITRVLFSNRRKMINKNFKKLFNKNRSIAKNLNLNLNVRPEELNNETYYENPQIIYNV